MSAERVSQTDHRIWVGRQRRDKTRKRLLNAIMSLFASRRPHDNLVIDDVIREAEVSRATFYAHFDSMEEATKALGQDLADEMLHSLELFLRRSENPVLRLAMGIQIFLLRSVTDPLWGAFVSRTDYFSRDTYLRKTVAGDLKRSKELHLIQFDELDAATSLYVGALMEAIRHLVKTNQRSRAYVEGLAVMVLRGVGVEYEHAKEIVIDRSIFIRGLAPDVLPWWRDPWRAD